VIQTRVTRRSEERQEAEHRLSTSEFYQQLFQSPGALDPRVKASQCFTKYKWRSADAAAADDGVGIVATQAMLSVCLSVCLLRTLAITY
jgi:hypothetical protein